MMVPKKAMPVVVKHLQKCELKMLVLIAEKLDEQKCIQLQILWYWNIRQGWNMSAV